jgi:hypothetical protein
LRLDYVADLQVGLRACSYAARLVVDVIGCGEQLPGGPMAIGWAGKPNKLVGTDVRWQMGMRKTTGLASPEKKLANRHPTSQPTNQSAKRACG